MLEPSGRHSRQEAGRGWLDQNLFTCLENCTLLTGHTAASNKTSHGNEHGVEVRTVVPLGSRSMKEICGLFKTWMRYYVCYLKAAWPQACCSLNLNFLWNKWGGENVLGKVTVQIKWDSKWEGFVCLFKSFICWTVIFKGGDPGWELYLEELLRTSRLHGESKS